jgi:hypothetical protein
VYARPACARAVNPCYASSRCCRRRPAVVHRSSLRPARIGSMRESLAVHTRVTGSSVGRHVVFSFSPKKISGPARYSIWKNCFDSCKVLQMVPFSTSRRVKLCAENSFKSGHPPRKYIQLALPPNSTFLQPHTTIFKRTIYSTLLSTCQAEHTQRTRSRQRWPQQKQK